MNFPTPPFWLGIAVFAAIPLVLHYVFSEMLGVQFNVPRKFWLVESAHALVMLVCVIVLVLCAVGVLVSSGVWLIHHG